MLKYTDVQNETIGDHGTTTRRPPFGLPFGVSKPSDCKVLVVSSWSEPAGDRAAIMAWECGEVIAYRCPTIIYLKQHAQTNQINYLKLRFFKKPGESRAKSVDQDAKKVYPSINPLRSLQSLSCPSTSPPTLGGKPKIRSLSCLETCKIVVIPP